jgi:1,4-alpha-glucan branching enzyme
MNGRNLLICEHFLIFMGCEFGQLIEWNHDSELSWDLLTSDMHRGVQATIRSLNQIYQTERALHECDFEPSGFQWVIGDDRAQSVLAFLRCGHEGAHPVLVICNFTPVPRAGYRIGVQAGHWHEILNTDAAGFGGSDIGNGGLMEASEIPSHGQTHSIELTLPPLATIFLRYSP